MSKPQPFEVRWDAADVEAVMDCIRAYPWPPQPAVPDGWAYGCDGAWLRELCAHWTNRYNWRAAMADHARPVRSRRGRGAVVTAGGVRDGGTVGRRPPYEIRRGERVLTCPRPWPPYAPRRIP